jgi:LPXTG-motif cell wall-anchored protein
MVERSVRVTRTVLGALALLAAMTTVVVTASASPAQAAPGCHGATCDHQNPQTMGCQDDAVTVESVTIPGAGANKADLRWSPACNAAWGRAVGTDPNFQAWLYGYHEDPETSFPELDPPFEQSGGATPDGTFSLMLSFDLFVRVCAFNGTDTANCTGLHNAAHPPAIPTTTTTTTTSTTTAPSTTSTTSTTATTAPTGTSSTTTSSTAGTSTTSRTAGGRGATTPSTTIATAAAAEGSLPVTGAGVLPVAVLAMLLIAAGGFLVVLRRRQPS